MPTPDTPNPSPPTANHGDRDHARFSPSAAHRWLACPASIVLSEQYHARYGREPSGPAADFGRRCHEVAERALTNPPGSTIVPDDMTVHVMPFVSNTRALLAELELMHGSEKVRLLVEQRLVTGIRDVWGTLDVGITVEVEEGRHDIYVIDLKTGGDYVPVAENPQLLIYALGMARNLPAVREVTLIISQATYTEQPWQHWRASGTILRPFRARVRDAVAAANSPLTQPNSGPHCQYCPARGVCPVHIRTVTEVFGENVLTPEVVPQAPALELMTAEQRAGVQARILQIRRFLDALEEFNLTHPPPGWKVVEGRSRRRWREDVDVLSALRVHNIQPRMSPVTITDLRTLVPSAVASELIENLTVVPPGSPTLAPVSDPRPALALGTDAFTTQPVVDGSVPTP